MNRKTLSTASLALAAGLLLGGCNSTVIGDNIDDQIRDGISGDGAEGILTSWNASEAPDLSVPEDDIQSFGRTYGDVSVNYDITQNGKIAEATVERVASGVFSVVYTDGTTVTKAIADDLGRRDLTASETEGGEWNVDRVSVFSGSSADNQTQITKVTVQWGENEMVFDDPATMHDRDVLTFAPNEPVTVTVTLNDGDVIGVIHQLANAVEPLSHKLLASVSELELVNTYLTPSEPGQYFTYVDVFDRAAVSDTDTPYSAAAWGMPYFVTE
jgi:hypothetical protein